MKFRDYILSTRQRLQDLRNSSGIRITTASENGIRWSSDDLVEICKGALHELSRTLVANKLIENVNQAYNYTTRIVTIEPGTGIVTEVDTTDLDIDFVNIKALQYFEPSINYSIVDQEEFVSKRNRIKEVDGSVVVEGYYATMMYDSNKEKAVIKTLPIPAEAPAAPCELTYESNLDAIYTITSETELPFLKIDDLMLDYAEREARAREHNDQRASILTAMINNKIKELVNGLSGNIR